MEKQLDAELSGAPLVYAFFGTVLLAIGGMLFMNLDENPGPFMVLAVLFTAPGLYLVIAGAVARGVLMARR